VNAETKNLRSSVFALTPRCSLKDSDQNAGRDRDRHVSFDNVSVGKLHMDAADALAVIVGIAKCATYARPGLAGARNRGRCLFGFFCSATTVCGGRDAYTTLPRPPKTLVHPIRGATVIQAIDNGMGLLSLSAGAKFAVTGLVLFIAAAVDALSHRGRTAAGLG
jgi:ABC-type xylose transport system permease subunit